MAQGGIVGGRGGPHLYIHSWASMLLVFATSGTGLHSCFLYICYQKPLPYHLVINCLALEIIEVSSQEACRFPLPAYCKTLRKQLASQGLQAALSQRGNIILLSSLVSSLWSMMSEMSATGIPRETKSPERNLVEYKSPLFEYHLLFWQLASRADASDPSGREGAEVPISLEVRCYGQLCAAFVWWGPTTAGHFAFNIVIVYAYLLLQ